MRMRLLAAGLVAAGLARAEDVPSGALPEPVREAGVVPISEPIAPVPAGAAPWLVAASLASGIADPFHAKVAFGVDVRRGFGAWALELSGLRAVSWSSPALAICAAGAACSAPAPARLAATPGDLSWVAGVGGAYRFAIGKASVSGRAPFAFALEGRAGAAAVRWHVSDPTPRDAWSPGVRAGLGLVGSAGSGFDARVGLDFLGYRTDVRGANAFERQWFAGLGLAWRPGGMP